MSSVVVDREIGLVKGRDVAVSIYDVGATTERSASVARCRTTHEATSTLRRCVGVVGDALRTIRGRNSGADDGFLWRREGCRISWCSEKQLRRLRGRRGGRHPAGDSSRTQRDNIGRSWRGLRHVGASRGRCRVVAIPQFAPLFFMVVCQFWGWLAIEAPLGLTSREKIKELSSTELEQLRSFLRYLTKIKVS